VQRQSQRDTTTDFRVPAGATGAGDGIVAGDGPVTVDAFVDYQCPFCKRFEERSGPALVQMVAERAISLVHHPLGFLDRLSGTRYSSRAAAAAGCAADAGAFLEYSAALFANQPAEGTPGLSDGELIELGRGIGIDDPSFPRCVSNRVYLAWVEYVTARAVQRGVNGTPTVFVEGIPVPADAGSIAAAVAAAAGAA
jgi:protein-disulfide isomerase